MGKKLPFDNNSRVLVLSPHLDDALFSAAQLIEETKAEVWTSFAGIPDSSVVTAWDRGMGFESGFDQMTARRIEDQNAFEGHSAQVKQLDYLERAYCNPVQRKTDMQDLLARIEAWIAEKADQKSYIFIPAGAGVYMPPPLWEKLRREKKEHLTPAFAAENQRSQPPISSATETKQARSNTQTMSAQIKNLVRSALGKALHTIQSKRRSYYQNKGMLANEDHQALRDTVLNYFVNRQDVTLGFYEELPYAWSQKAQAEISRIAPAATVFEIPVDKERKHNRLKHYRSQTIAMDPQHRRFEQPETLPETETYWLLSQ